MIKIDGLKKEYSDFKLDISVEFENGTINGIVGTNGAGKSTLFKAILGLISYKEGMITINDKNVRDFKYADKERIGCVMTDSFFSETFSIKDIAAIMKATYKSFNRDAFIKKCEEHKLPLNKKIRDYMEENENRIVLISSHISSDIEKLCDTTYMINDGKIVFHDDTDRLLSYYAALKVDEDSFEKLDKSHIMAYKKEKYGYECLTNEKEYYSENYPSMVIEKMTVDEMMMIIIKGEKV